MNDRRRDGGLAQAEALLARAATTTGGSREALLRRAMEQCLPLAISLARRYRARGEPDDDLEQVAALAVVKAVRRYVPRGDVSLMAFAVPTIHGELKRHFRDTTWALRPPRRLQELQLAAHRVQGELIQQLRRLPTAADLAARLGVPEAEVREMQAAANGYLAAPLDPELLDRGGPVEDGGELDLALELDAVLPALDALRDDERSAVAMHYFGGMSQRRVAEHLGVSQVQVGRLLAAAVRKVRAAVGP